MNWTSRSYIPIFFLLALIACGKSSGFQAQEQSENAKDSKAQKGETGTGSLENSEIKGEDSTVQVITLPPAQAPVVVAGASLTCIHASAITTVSCRIYDGLLKPYVKDPQETIRWEILSDAGNVTLTASEIPTDKSGTFYYLNYGRYATSTLQARIINGLDEFVMKFDLKTLPKLTTNQSFVVTTPIAGTVYDVPYVLSANMVYGDDNIATEGDSCLTQAAIDKAKPFNEFGKTVSSQFQIKAAVQGLSVYLPDVCGLQTDTAVTFITNLSGTFYYESKLTPALAGGKVTLRAFQNIDLPADSYNIGIRNSTPGPDGLFDSFKTGGYQFRLN